MQDSLNVLDTLKGDEKIIYEAQIRFRGCEDWESTSRPRAIQDDKFAEADSYNGYQWSVNDIADRGERPWLTINKIRQHNLDIINDAKKNKPGIKIRAVSDEATFEAAEVFEGLVRHTEYISNAQIAYDTATTHQVRSGIGYWRVITDYEHDDTFNQEIFIKCIKNPLNVYLDPDIQEKDGSDARFGFLFDDIPIDLFKKKYPQYVDLISQSALGNTSDYNWQTDKHVRIAEYYCRTEKRDVLWAIPNKKTGEIDYIRKSVLPREIVDALLQSMGPPEEREIIDHDIMHYTIVGNKIAERKKWLGKYVPIVRLLGEETVIEGIMDRKGHTRALIDPQRMFNYNASAAVEYGALQTKSPWAAPAAAIEGYETYWGNANNVNYSVLPYNHVDDNGNPIPAPERIAPPQNATIFIEGMTMADSQMMMASGQYEANLGRKSNEVSGKAIDARDRQGDNATYHFIDNLGIAIRFTGKILLDLYPKIYDTERVVHILAEDGEQSQVTLDPTAKQAFMAQEAKEGQAIKSIFNPNVGRYDVISDIGPAYATKRQEAFNALTQIISNNEPAFTLLGDLWAKNSDFAEADKVAERLARMVPAQAKSDQPPPELMAIQQQNSILQKELAGCIQELAGERLKIKKQSADKSVDEYKAITDRLDTLMKHIVVTPKDNAQMLHEVMVNQQQSDLAMTQAEHAVQIQPEEQNEPSPTQSAT